MDLIRNMKNNPENLNSRIVSLVPSWTETLLYCDANVIARTRFCIHPQTLVKNIAIVGGTKKVNWQRIAALQPDLILMDKEENTVQMAEESPFRYLATHVCAIEDMPSTCDYLAEQLQLNKLHELAKRWQSVINAPLKPFAITQLPGLINWLIQPTQKIETIVYLIWRNPWLTITQQTFIGSVLMKLGLPILHIETDTRYPEVNLNELDPNTTLLLFTTEPYPFHKKTDQLSSLGFPCAIVDGEKFSWFGIRSLLFLESCISIMH